MKGFVNLTQTNDSKINKIANNSTVIKNSYGGFNAGSGSTGYGVSVGKNANAGLSSVAIGSNTTGAVGGTAIGDGAYAWGAKAVQLANGANTYEGTLKFRDFRVVDKDGKLYTNLGTETSVNMGLVASEQYVKDLIGGVSGGVDIRVVDVLPTENISTTTIYLVPNASGTYDEYLYVNNRWEQIGNTDIKLDNYYDKSEIDSLLLNTHKQIILGADGVLEGNVYNFTVESPESYIDYRTNGTKFLVDLHLPIAGDLDTTKEVAITFGDTVYYVYNILKGQEHSTIGDLHQVDKYNNATGYRFIAEMTFFDNSEFKGFAIVPTISMSDVLSLTSDEMDAYLADGGLTQGQLAICNKVITNGYTDGGLYRFDITYPDTYAWTALSGGSGVSQEEFDKLLNNETLIANSSGNFRAGTNANGTGVAIGKSANANGDTSISIGNGSFAMNVGAIAIGKNSYCFRGTSIQLGTGTNMGDNSFQIYDDNIYNWDTHTLTVQNIELNGKPLKSHALETLTLTGDDVLTSTETFTTYIQILVEFETDGIHAGFDCVLHPYDEAVCFVTYDVLVNGQPNFGTAYLNENGNVVINIPSGLTFSNVNAKYIIYG